MRTLVVSSLAALLAGAAVGAALAFARVGLWDDTRIWGDAGQTGAASTSFARPRVEIETTEFNFGTMERGTTQTHAFVLSNRGNAPLKLNVGNTTCKCTIGRIPNDSVLPGESAEIQLQWSAKTGDGPFRQSATIITNDPERPQLDLVVVGDVTASSSVSPGEFHFGKIPAGQEQEASVVLLSFHSDQLELKDYDLPGTDRNEDFRLEQQSLSVEDLPDERARAGLRLLLTAPATMPIGHFHRWLTLYTNLPNLEKLELPVIGRVVGEISIFGRNWDDDRGALRLGSVKSDSGAITKLIVAVRGAHSSDFELSVAEVDPPELSVRIGARQQISETMSHVPLTIEVPPGTRPMIRLSTAQGEAGRVALKTNHPNAPTLDLQVVFAVEP